MNHLTMILVCLLASPSAVAGGKKKPSPEPVPLAFDGKQVIEFLPVPETEIDLPDDKKYPVGFEYQARLTTLLLATGKYIAFDPNHPRVGDVGLKNLAVSQDEVPDFVWASSVTPTVRIQVGVEALAFITGTRGDRMFYGFDERVQNRHNEFPIQTGLDRQSWFGNTFETKGESPMDSRSGLDLGTSFNIDFLIGWLAIKHERYRSKMRFHVEVESPWTGAKRIQNIEVEGKGYFWDVAGGYEGYDGGLTLARRDALLQAFQKAIDGSLSSVVHATEGLPLAAEVDQVISHENGSWVLLGTGHQAQVRAGLQFYAEGNKDLVLEVARSNFSGAVARVVQGDVSQVQPGMRFVQVQPTAVKVVDKVALKSRDQVQERTDTLVLPEQELPRAQFEAQARPSIGRWYVFIESLRNTLALPYRIWRYYQYDQEWTDPSRMQVHGKSMPASEEPAAPEDLKPFAEISLPLFPEPVLKDRILDSSKREVVVAVIDSGVDYNHPNLKKSIYTGEPGAVGWDYSSNDARPFDDGYHGTQVAGLIHAEAPYAKILPLKIFSPWGTTTSGAIISAFQHAIAQGAEIIVCPWATNIRSTVLEEGMALAREKGILVVAAAGDMGFSLSQVPAYPASFARDYDNILVVGALGKTGEMLKTDLKESNFDPRDVALAVMAEEIRVLEPRGRASTDSGTGLSAAIVAGRVAHDLADLPKGDVSHALERLMKDTVVRPDLTSKIREGRVLK